MNELWLDGWVVTHREQGKDEIVATAEFSAVPESCPKCGVIGRLYKHGTKVVEYRDAPAFGKKLIVRVDVRRFRCRDCGATSMQPLPDMDARRQLTKRCVEYIEEQGLARPYIQVADSIGIDEKTVREICGEMYERRLKGYRAVAPTILGIDELTLLRKRRAIFVDVENRIMLDLLDDMNKPIIDRWLYLLPGKEKIKVVTMDMWDAYRKSVRAILPQAVIVVDRWHIQSKAGMALDKVRNRVRHATKSKKNPWANKRLLQTSRHNLSPARKFLVDGMILNDPLLSAGWHTKESFYDIWEAGSRTEAERLFDVWKEAIPELVAKEFKPVAKTVESWREEIFAYFDHKYTNAFTEAMNGLVKIINRAGRGYSFASIRAKALLGRQPGDPTEQCPMCNGMFPKLKIEKAHVVPMHNAVGKLRRPVKVCEACHRFHTESWFTRYHGSTPKSG